MKKLLYVLMAGTLFACSTSTQLTQFNKQKYTKKFHAKKVKYEDKINSYANNTESINEIERKKLDVAEVNKTTRFENLYKPTLKKISKRKKNAPIFDAKTAQGSKEITSNNEISLNDNAVKFNSKKEIKKAIKRSARGGSDPKGIMKLGLIIFLVGLILYVLAILTLALPLAIVAYLAMVIGWIMFLVGLVMLLMS